MNIDNLFNTERLIKIFDKKYNFSSAFDPQTGFYWRSGILEANGEDTNKEPFMAEFPHLLDIGIMGHCQHGLSGRCVANGVQCYQSGSKINLPNMKLADFKRIVDECKGRVYQFALGGRGDPDMHEDFEKILKYSRENNIVPNLTTSGFGIDMKKTELIKKYCGAAAVSWYRTDYTKRAIEQFINAGIKTNIHFILSKNTINEAIELLKNGKPYGINRIIFLLFKPVGLGTNENILDATDVRVEEFFKRFDNKETSDIAGFDSCSVPAMINYTKKIAPESYDACEGARFSAYISADMHMMPCSFDQDKKWTVSLNDYTIENVWNSEVFDNFRNKMLDACPHCKKKELCMGGCPIRPEIILCVDKKER